MSSVTAIINSFMTWLGSLFTTVGDTVPIRMVLYLTAFGWIVYAFRGGGDGGKGGVSS